MIAETKPEGFDIPIIRVPNKPVNYQEKPNSSKIEELDNSILNNCYLFVKSKRPDLPQMKVIMESDKLWGTTGNVVYFNYNGLQHFAYIIADYGDSFLIEETNYNAGKYSQRIIDRQDIAIRAYY